MIESEWLRHLAEATFADGNWTASNPESVQALFRRKVSEAIPELARHLQDATEIFNAARLQKTEMMKVMTLPGESRVEKGFVLVFSGRQMRVRRADDLILVDLTTYRGFVPSNVLLFRMTPEIDPFGGVSWRIGKHLLTDLSHIARNLMEELVKASHDT